MRKHSRTNFQTALHSGMDRPSSLLEPGWPLKTIACSRGEKVWDYLNNGSNPIKEFAFEIGENTLKWQRLGHTTCVFLVGLMAVAEVIFLAILAWQIIA